MKPDADALVDGLRAYGVRYITGGSHTPSPEPPDANELIGGLAEASDARVRYALAALFLVRPELAALAPTVADALPAPAKDVLIEAYVAAVYLQRAWRTRLHRYLGEQPSLPPLWIRELGLPDPDERFGRAGLLALRARQKRGATARHGIYEQVALNLFGQLVAERGAGLAAAA